MRRLEKNTLIHRIQEVAILTLSVTMVVVLTFRSLKRSNFVTFNLNYSFHFASVHSHSNYNQRLSSFSMSSMSMFVAGTFDVRPLREGAKFFLFDKSAAVPIQDTPNVQVENQAPASIFFISIHQHRHSVRSVN